jgi:hypothetical protein
MSDNIKRNLEKKGVRCESGSSASRKGPVAPFLQFVFKHAGSC